MANIEEGQGSQRAVVPVMMMMMMMMMILYMKHENCDRKTYQNGRSDVEPSKMFWVAIIVCPPPPKQQMWVSWREATDFFPRVYESETVDA
jgi:hypothetical protein